MGDIWFTKSFMPSGFASYISDACCSSFLTSSISCSTQKERDPSPSRKKSLMTFLPSPITYWARKKNVVAYIICEKNIFFTFQQTFTIFLLQHQSPLPVIRLTFTKALNWIIYSFFSLLPTHLLLFRCFILVAHQTQQLTFKG